MQRRFQEIARRVRPQIVARATALTRDPDLADDIAQETLLRLWQLRGQIDAMRSVDAMALTIARNLAVDALRRRRGAAVSLDALEGFDPPDPTGEADRALARAEAQAQTDAVLSSLTPPQQALMRMRHTDGLSTAEIAALTGTSEANVRVKLCRARARIRELFTNPDTIR